jgi:hypothetical protein
VTGVTRIGITGHTNLSPHTQAEVARRLREVLESIRPLIGVTCLARGADQIFARVVLELAGEIEVVLPSADYRDSQVEAADVVLFDELVYRAIRVRVMPFAHADRTAYLAAGQALVAGVDRLVAVWDGQEDTRPGSTADVVRAAGRIGVPVTLVWPEGAERL